MSTRLAVLLLLSISVSIGNGIGVIMEEMPEATNALCICSGTHLLIQKIETNLGAARREGIHFVLVTLAKLVLLDLLLAQHAILKAVRDGIGVVSV